jgi:hypothetical protein
VSMRRLTRLMNAFSKRSRITRSRGTLLHVLQLRRVQVSVRATPAIEAAVANHVWSVAEIVGLLR